MKTKKKTKIFFKALKKSVSIKNVILLIVLLAGNTFAWFIYARDVSNDIDVHVRSWKILLMDGDTEVTNDLSISVPGVYPGMDDFEQEITIENQGETAAEIRYVILSASVLGEDYMTEEGYTQEGLTASEDAMTSSELENFLSTNYPFSIEFNVSDVNVIEGSGVSTYTISVTWPYESGDDEADTYWGNEAYNFLEENPDSPCIELFIKIYVTQKNASLTS